MRLISVSDRYQVQMRVLNGLSNVADLQISLGQLSLSCPSSVEQNQGRFEISDRRLNVRFLIHHVLGQLVEHAYVAAYIGNVSRLHFVPHSLDSDQALRSRGLHRRS